MCGECFAMPAARTWPRMRERRSPAVEAARSARLFPVLPARLNSPECRNPARPRPAGVAWERQPDRQERQRVAAPMAVAELRRRGDQAGRRYEGSSEDRYRLSGHALTADRPRLRPRDRPKKPDCCAGQARETIWFFAVGDFEPPPERSNRWLRRPRVSP